MAIVRPTRDLRCSHCHRGVHETVHTRSSYTVDYYAMHTGRTETVSIQSEDRPAPLVYERLLTSEDVVTCVDCLRDATVREEIERRFRPERTAGDE